MSQDAPRKRAFKPRGPYSAQRVKGVGRPVGTEDPSTAKASHSPTTAELYWAAGFIEGEGYFSINRGKTKYGHRPGWINARVGACQQETEPLERLLAMFGGSIRTMKQAGITKSYRSNKDMHEWNAHGSRGRGVMMTLYPLLSKRRQARIQEIFAAHREYDRLRAEVA